MMRNLFHNLQVKPMLRLIAAACALACAAMMTPASAQVNFQGTYKYYPYKQMAKKKAAMKRAAWRAKRRAWRKSWRNARVPRAAKRARPNILRSDRAASASRSCLTAPTQAMLASLERAIGPVRVISTCRPGAVIAGTRRPSFHRLGMAVDFSTMRRAAAIAYLRSRGAFVMTYCNMGHIHFNLGQSGYSGCGRAAYASARRRR